jgi:hypothetical protein
LILYQGTTSVVPIASEKDSGFTPEERFSG